MAKKKEVLEVVRVFIASPGDVRKERTIFHDVIEELNEIKAARVGMYLVPVGWEDTLPGRGRPQALINEDLVTCDLIVGLLWRRWGTPTGKYSSGFEEEYELAREHDIDMWLYFRDVEEAMMADPGAHLRQVLDFRDRIERERALLFHGYADEEDWEKKLRRHISLWLDKLPQDPPPEIAVDDLQTRIAELEQALEKAKSDQEKVALDLVKDAWEFANGGQLTRAEEFFARAVNVAPEPSVRLEHTRFLQRTGQLERVEEILKDLLDVAGATEDSELGAKIHGNLGLVYRVRGDLDKAEEMHLKSLEINEALGRKEGMAMQNGNLGLVYSIRGEFDQAEEFCRKSLMINEELSCQEGIADQYGNLGNIYRKRGDLDKAEAMYRKVMEIEEVLGRRESMANTYGNLGIVYQMREDFDQAEEMYLSALEMEEILGRKEGRANAYYGLGNLYVLRQDLDQAEEFFRRGVVIDEELGRKRGLAGGYSNLGTVYHLRGDLDEATVMYLKSLAFYKALGNQSMVEQVKAWIKELEEEKRGQ